jgi:hypothetical protein
MVLVKGHATGSPSLETKSDVVVVDFLAVVAPPRGDTMPILLAVCRVVVVDMVDDDGKSVTGFPTRLVDCVVVGVGIEENPSERTTEQRTAARRPTQYLIFETRRQSNPETTVVEE